MQHSIYQDTTFHNTPYSTSHILHFNHMFHLTPYLKLQHSTSHHISHCTIIHVKSLHHISVHHSTSRPHSTSRHTMLITTFKYKLHITLSHSAQYKPHHTSHTAFQPSFMSNMASNHSTSLSIPQPHFTYCITAHHHIPHAPRHHSTSHHHISHLV